MMNNSVSSILDSLEIEKLIDLDAFNQADRGVILRTAQALSALEEQSNSEQAISALDTTGSAHFVEDSMGVDLNTVSPQLDFDSAIAKTFFSPKESTVLPAWDEVKIHFNNSERSTGFNIKVVFRGSGLTPSQQAIFDEAARRWSEVIIGDIPNFTLPGGLRIDDLAIVASAPSIDGSGGILGQAGPLVLRPLSRLPVLGIMEFDSADLAALEAAGQLDEVILHEMGHVLGFGTIWAELDLITGAGTNNPQFVGVGATAEFNAAFGLNATSIPVENTGGPGTADGHWRETVFDNELMTGFLNPGVENPLSAMTVAAMGDMGYQVNVAAADPYIPPGSVSASATGVTGQIVALDVESANALLGTDGLTQVMAAIAV